MAKTIKKKKYPFIILPNQPEYGKKGQYLHEEDVGLETTDIRDDLGNLERLVGMMQLAGYLSS